MITIVFTFSMSGWSMTICPIIPISWSEDNAFIADSKQLSSGSSTATSVRNFLQYDEPYNIIITNVTILIQYNN